MISTAKNKLSKNSMNHKQAILKAAIHLFAERGFSAKPTSAVEKSAGVAERQIV
jgi:AcrR family transcriptional regulator